MKVNVNFLRGLSIGTEIDLVDVDNVGSVLTMCNFIKRNEGQKSFQVRTYPLERKVSIKVMPYDYRKGLQATS